MGWWWADSGIPDAGGISRTCPRCLHEDAIKRRRNLMASSCKHRPLPHTIPVRSALRRWPRSWREGFSPTDTKRGGCVRGSGERGRSGVGESHCAGAATPTGPEWECNGHEWGHLFPWKWCKGARPQRMGERSVAETDRTTTDFSPRAEFHLPHLSNQNEPRPTRGRGRFAPPTEPKGGGRVPKHVTRHHLVSSGVRRAQAVGERKKGER